MDSVTPKKRPDGTLSYERYKVYKRGVTAAMSAPTLKGNGVNVKDPYAVWGIVKPAGITSYDYQIWRYVRWTYQDEEQGAWIMDEEVIGATASAAYVQPTYGDPVAVRVLTLAGAAGTGFTLLYKGASHT